MSIYHFSAKTISRSAGRSATAAAAYRAAEKIVDARTGEVHDYTRKAGVLSRAVVLPGGTTMSRAALWNAVEQKHKRSDALVAREFEIALPHELSHEQRESLITAYARELADTYQVAIDVNVHAPADGDKNYHAHVMLSACHVDSAGVCGKKAVELDPIHCARAKIENAVDVQRRRWQDVCNAALEKAGSASRIDHRSLVAQGITDRPPGVHLGPAATAIVRRAEQSTIAARARAAADEFLARAAADAAHAVAAVAAVTELERELAQAQQDAQIALEAPVKRRSIEELQSGVSELHERLRDAQAVLDFAARKRPAAKPGSEVDRAKGQLQALSARLQRAQSTERALEKEAAALGFWRFLRKREIAHLIVIHADLVQRLAKEYALVVSVATSDRLEKIDAAVAHAHAQQLSLSAECRPLERELKELMRASQDAQSTESTVQAPELLSSQRAEELAAIDRILVEQARERLATPRERERQR